MNKSLEKFLSSLSDEDSLGFSIASSRRVKIEAISTGCHTLDDALSCGGFPKGRVSQLYGEPGSSKTLVSMLTIISAQSTDPEAVQIFYDAEQSFDIDWFESLGGDCDRLILVDDDSAALGAKLIESLVGIPRDDGKGKKQEGVLDKIAKKELNCNLIVIDSLGAIIPPLEERAKVTTNNIGLLARFLTTNMKKVDLEVKKANVVLIVINHKKEGMDMYGPDHTFSGGNAYTHFLSANIYLRPVKSKDSAILDEKERKVGGKVAFTIEKSKFGPWPRKGEYKINYATGFVDVHEQVATLAIDYDVIKRPNNVTYLYGEESFRGIEALYTAVKEKEGFKEELLTKINEARASKKNISTSDSTESEEESVEESDVVETKRGRKKKDA